MSGVGRKVWGDGVCVGGEGGEGLAYCSLDEVYFAFKGWCHLLVLTVGVYFWFRRRGERGGGVGCGLKVVI